HCRRHATRARRRGSMNLFSNPFARRKTELHEEINAHLKMDIEDRRARGESEQHARAAATREFGNVGLIADVTRETWGLVWLERLGQDLQYALRQLKRSPVFTFT